MVKQIPLIPKGSGDLWDYTHHGRLEEDVAKNEGDFGRLDHEMK